MFLRFCAYAGIRIIMQIDAISALAEPTRLRAVALLWDGSEHCACELIELLGATQSRVSRHMNILKSVGIVVDRRDAQWVRYRISPDLTRELRDLVAAALAVAGQGDRRAA